MNVLDLLRKKKLDFVPAGRDYKICCLSPDHDDTNPSLHVDMITGMFHCFACGFKGNIFTFFEEKGNFLQQRRELLRRKLEQKLAENVGLDLPKNRVPFVQKWRNIDGETFSQFEAFEHNDNNFIGRVVFPIRSVSGKILGFNGRALSPERTPKYLITPASSKFPLFPARPKLENGHVILVEGIFDMLNLYDKGLRNVVCAFGTQKITKDKLVLLKVQGAHTIDVLLDNDDAGREAANKAKDLIESLEMTCQIVTLPESIHDAGELTARQVLKLKEKLYG